MRHLENVILANIIPEVIASVAHASFVPCVWSHPDKLRNSRCQRQCVLCACFAAVVVIAFVITVCIVAKHQEVVTVPVLHIVSEMSPFESVVVDLNRHKEYTIISISVASSIFVGLGDVIPLTATIAPIISVQFGRPWISHFDKLITSAQLDDSKDSIGMTLNQSICVLVVVVIARSVHLNHIFVIIFALKNGPELIYSVRIMAMGIVGSSTHSTSGSSRVSTDGMSIVAVVLSEGLLQKGDKER